MSHWAYLGLGSSLGNRLEHLRDALERLNLAAQGTTVQAVSPLYETPHLGLEPGDTERFPPHFNCVAQVTTSLTPLELLARIHEIEAQGARRRDTRWGPRTIDIDILLYDDLQMQTEALTLPHPGILARIFVVRPLLDIAPNLALPDGRRLCDALANALIPDLKPNSDLDLMNDDKAAALSAQAIRRVEPDELLI